MFSIIRYLYFDSDILKTRAKSTVFARLAFFRLCFFFVPPCNSAFFASVFMSEVHSNRLWLCVESVRMHYDQDI